MRSIAAYIKTSNANQNSLIHEYAGLVKKIAHHLIGRLPSSVQLDDLMQAGMVGLLEASKNYDPSKGASFETYASIRIRGTMLDEVRKENWVPRSVHKNSRKISEAIQKLENKLGRDVRDQEIAEALNITINEYHLMLQDVNSSHFFTLEEVMNNENVIDEAMKDGISDPLEGVQYEDFCGLLAQGIKGLPDRERLVLALYYDEELNLKEIGAVLGVSESRACQIHSQAMLRLRSRVVDWKR